MKNLEFHSRIGILTGIFLQTTTPILADMQATILHGTLGINSALAERIGIYSCLGFGTVALVWGCSCLAKSKGYHWSLGVLGILSCAGVLPIALLPDRNGIAVGSEQYDLIKDHRNAVGAITLSMFLQLSVWPVFRIAASADPHKSLAYIEPYANLYPALQYAVVPAVLGLLFSLIGSYYLLKRKGYGGFFSIAGFLSLFGWLLLFILPDRNRERISEPNRSFRSFASFVCLFMGLGSIYIAIDFPMGISYVRVFRDRMAAENMESLGKALEKFGRERGRCDLEVSASENIIRYMVGPYYGWSGTNRDVRVWINKDEVHGCALSGTRPGGRNTRYIYRIKFADGSVLPSIQGRINPEGKTYGRPGETCYTDTLIGPDCRIRKHSGSPCK